MSCLDIYKHNIHEGNAKRQVHQAATNPAMKIPSPNIYFSHSDKP